MPGQIANAILQSAECCTGGCSHTADLWVDCAVCGNRYDAYSSSCPRCGAGNVSDKGMSSKSSTGRKVALAAGIAVAVVAVALLIPALAMVLTQSSEDDVPGINILPPKQQEPKLVPKEELVEHALQLINNDRAKFGIPAVMLSTNQAAQIHAEDVFKNKQISHWMSSGEKPYMTYTMYGGMGSVSQNVAIAGFSKAQYQECLDNVLYDCEKIAPMSAIEELQYEMMYKDAECCDDGHRNNILNEYHTHVSIGVFYDEYYLAFVQNFENNYGLEVTVSDEQARISGELLSGSIEYIDVYYDPIPDPSIYEENKRLLAYSGGELVATVVKPLPPGYYYEKPEGYRLIVANKWNLVENNVEITFNLARAVSADGVYTIYTVVKDAEGGENFEATSYSVFIESRSS